MFDKDFYPTPNEVIKKMLEPYMTDSWEYVNEKYNNILEPSAWKWNIVDYLKEKAWHYSKNNVYVLENNFELKEILKTKNVRFLGNDFLKYNDDINFDLIIMNPPFSNWVDHLLKAWDIIQNWEIVCLLNSETYNNANTKKRALLKSIVDENWTTEELWDCFSSAERKTNVNVIMVRLSKETKSKFDFDYDKFSKERKIDLDEEYIEKWIENKDVLKNITRQYKETKELFIETLNHINKLALYTKTLTWNEYFKIEDYLLGYWWPNERYNNYMWELKLQTWNRLIDKIWIRKHMTNDLSSNFNKFIQEQWDVELNEENIKELLWMLLLNKWNILENTIPEVFDLFTKYYKENRSYVEGWKTNDRFKVNKKIILPNYVDYKDRYSSNNGFSLSYNRRYQDIDKVMCYITWKDMKDIITVEDALKADFAVWRKLTESTFFNLRYYKKWTLHMQFKDDFLWQEFNMRSCAGKNWLPENEKKEWEENSRAIKVL